MRRRIKNDSFDGERDLRYRAEAQSEYMTYYRNVR
jgi:hypothetical protein